MIEEIKQKIECGQAENLIRKGLYERSLRAEGCFGNSGQVDAQGIPILGREKTSPSDPNVKTASDFVNLIGTEKAGYLAYNIQRIYKDDIEESLREKYEDFDRLNAQSTLHSEIMEADAIMGDCFALYYISNGEIKKKKIQPWTAGIIYDENNVPVYGYIYEDLNICISSTTTLVRRIFVYDNIYRYEHEERSYAKETTSNRWYLKEKAPHGFQEVPVNEFLNNNKKLGNAEKAIAYIDAYDRVLSDSTTEQSASRQAYLLLKAAGDIDEVFMEKLRKFGVMATTGDGDAKWLEKNLNPQFAALILKELEKNIYRFGIIVDNDRLMGISNPRKNQIEFIYRAMDNDCDTTEKQWKQSLEREDRILKSFWTTMASPSVADYDTFDIDYIFHRNKPEDPVADLEAMERAGVKLPNYHKLIKLGYEEEEARALSAEADEEMIASFGDIDDTSDEEDEEGDN